MYTPARRRIKMSVKVNLVAENLDYKTVLNINKKFTHYFGDEAFNVKRNDDKTRNIKAHGQYPKNNVFDSAYEGLYDPTYHTDEFLDNRKKKLMKEVKAIIKERFPEVKITVNPEMIIDWTYEEAKINYRRYSNPDEVFKCTVGRDNY